MEYDNSSTILVQLTKGYTAIVDDCDADLADMVWAARVESRGIYATKQIDNNKMILARVVLERKLDRPIREGYLCDHINRNTLDNRRSNLREATRSQNRRNSRLNRNNTSGYRGVSWDNSRKLWKASFKINKQQVNIGHYETKQEAHQAYIEARRKHGLLPPETGGMNIS